MPKYKCIIVEDEPLAAELLAGYVAQTPFLELTKICTDALFAMELLQTAAVDLIFLDIHLPKLKGLDFLASVKNPPAAIITSAYQDYALQAFDLNIVDYLLKPIRYERFLKAVNKLTGTVIPATRPGQQPLPLNQSYFYFNVEKRKIRINVEEILYVESIREYIKIITTDKTIQTKMQLTQIGELLPGSGFLRVHRSFIVAVDKITAFSATDIEIKTNKIPIGRSYKEWVIAALEQNK